jgi:outer membrane protein OmpA-like peptidoglycan-associated protein
MGSDRFRPFTETRGQAPLGQAPLGQAQFGPAQAGQGRADPFQAGQTQFGRTQVRRWRRLLTPAPFLPYGLLPLLGFLLLFAVALTMFARGAVENVALRSAQSALTAGGFDWAKPRASGQWITLDGTPPSPAAGEQAIAAVRAAEAETVFGLARPVTRVSDRFTRLERPLVIERSGDEPGRLDADPSPEDLSRDAITPNEPVLDGRRDSAPAPASPEVAACDQRLDDILSSAQVRFETASVRIGAGNGELLDIVARAAASCPGTLLIEGHTDSDGGAAYNAALSRRRAEAVRLALVERGVPAERLSVAGYGEGRPIASNDTAVGRERNRRIEMRVAPAPT